MGNIDFTPKTDRELLITVAEQGNAMREDIAEIKKQLATLNGIVRHHDRVIARIQGSYYGTVDNNYLPRSKVRQAGIITGLFFLISFIACAVQAFGRAMGWW